METKNTTYKVLEGKGKKEGKVRNLNGRTIEVMSEDESVCVQSDGQHMHMWLNGCHKHVSIVPTEYIEDIDYVLGGSDLDKVSIMIDWKDNKGHPYLTKTDRGWVLTVVRRES